MFLSFLLSSGIGMMIAGKITNILTGRIPDSKLLLIGLCQGLIFGILFLVGIVLDFSYICIDYFIAINLNSITTHCFH